jgi:hypothetical protein
MGLIGNGRALATATTRAFLREMMLSTRGSEGNGRARGGQMADSRRELRAQSEAISAPNFHARAR